MTHQVQLVNAKYRNWVKSALGLKYVKEGLEPFCDDVVKQQHGDILNKVKQKRNLAVVNCSLCNLRSLQPDHVRTKKKICPLGQVHCNCQFPNGKIACPNSVCGAIYDEIVGLHGSRSPAPYWKNTDPRLWCSEPWSIAKCFINASGYAQKMSASEIDCSGLLHLFINNKGFQKHLHCKITGNDVFARVRQYRNSIFHSDTMEMEDADVIKYIEDMISLLQDSHELHNRPESQSAVQKLLQLKGDSFTISTSDESEVKAAVTSLKELEKTIEDELDKLGSDIKQDLEQTSEVIKKDVSHTVSAIRKDVEHRGSDTIKEMETKGSEIKADVEKTGFDIKKDLEDSGRAVLEEVAEKRSDLNKEILYLKEPKFARKISRTDINKQKKEFQTKLVNMYNDHVIKISALPLLPERDLTVVSDVYVPPLMTSERKRDKRFSGLNSSSFEQSKRITMHEILKKEGKSAQNVYILGGAGSGKSVFCKGLVSHWCMAHSKEDFDTVQKSRYSKFGKLWKKFKKAFGKQSPNGDIGFPLNETVKEVGKFEFLFYISLRHCSACKSIQMMLEDIYGDAILHDVLENDSGKCLIVLDGLDEWTPHSLAASQFQTRGLPERDTSKHYTVITTSRPWKFYALQISDSEIDHCITLKGIDELSINHLSENTIAILNKMFNKQKSAEDFQNDVKNNPVADIIHIPMILQQLVCLWFDDKLEGSSKCAVYSSMLDLFFEWASRKASNNEENDEGSIALDEQTDFELPLQIKHYKACCDNKHVLHFLSRLAYETLFDQNKERTLAFTSSKLSRVKMSNYVKTCSLKFGILSEDRCVSLHASNRDSSSYSFIHKSFQEYLAAMYIAIRVRKMSKTPATDDYSDDCKKGVFKYLGVCKTVDDILEQSNVFTMLCGIEPQLTPYVSEYIYTTATADKRVMDCRFACKSKSVDERFVLDVQKCIISCLHEVISVEKQYQVRINMGDIFIDYDQSPGDILFFLEKHVLVLDSKRYLDIRNSKEWFNEGAKEYLTACKHLKAIRYHGNSTTMAKADEKISELLVKNVSSLECLLLYNATAKIMKHFVQNLPNMRQLISLQIKDQKQSHEVCGSLSTLLTQSTQLQQIAVDIHCSYNDQHMINFTKHKQLRHVLDTGGDFYVSKVSGKSLVVCKLQTYSTVGIKDVAESLYRARKLKELELCAVQRHECSDNEPGPETVAENLARLLPSLSSLSALNLRGYTLAGNVITHPSDMTNLKQIRLNCVTMDMATWCRFIDSLPALPQTVIVKTSELNVTDAKECDGRSPYNEEMTEKAHQYVRDKTNLFKVKWDVFDFNFKSKKVEA